MHYQTRFTPLILVLTILTSGCTYLGEYTYGGEFPNIQLPAKGKVIGMLDPRGPALLRLHDKPTTPPLRFQSIPVLSKPRSG